MRRLSACLQQAASHRLRIVLALKRLGVEAVPAHLAVTPRRGRGRSPRPGGPVTALADRDLSLSQSLAIIEYLDETYPYPPLLPALPAARARVRAIAFEVACEIHPLNNLRVLDYLGTALGASAADQDRWVRHWAEAGLAAIESRLAGHADTGRFCCGEHPTLADCCLVPQVHAARLLGCRLEHLPTVLRIDAECLMLAEFAGATVGGAAATDAGVGPGVGPDDYGISLQHKGSGDDGGAP